MKRSFALIGVVALTAVSVAQVASHAPTVAAMPATRASATRASSTTTVPSISGKVVARVNGVALTDRDLVREMFMMFPYAQQHNGFPKDLEPEIRRGAMQMIIFEELLYQEAKRQNVAVSPTQLAAAQKSFRQQFATQAEYDGFLAEEGLKSKEALREKIRRSLLIDAMLNRDVVQKSKLSEAQVHAYYDKNKKQFYREETFHIQSISILPPNSSPDTLKEAQKRAEDAYKQAKDAKSYREFGLIAEKLSDDDYHVNYGDHKPRPRKEFPPEIVKAALAMQPGQVSQLIRLGNAYTIFRLVAHTPAGPAPFSEVKTQLWSDLQKQKTEEVRAELGKSLRKDSKIEIL